MCTFYFNMSDFSTHALSLGFLQFVAEYCNAPFLGASEVNSTASVAWGRTLLQDIPTNAYLLSC